jgi:hypothetical protein
MVKIKNQICALKGYHCETSMNARDIIVPIMLVDGMMVRYMPMQLCI